MDDKRLNLRDYRENYSKSKLIEGQLDSHPLQQFDRWMKEAVQAQLPEPNAMTLSTISSEGFPESRVVLLKEVLQDKFVFYTNYESAKGKQIAAQPKVSLNFLWKELERQVRIVGVATKVAAAISDSYFKSRPRGSQIGAWVSPQSKVLHSREELDALLVKFERQFENSPHIQRPPHWGGYEVEPMTIEFWQGRTSRLHDRILYKLLDENWIMQRLAP